MKEKHLYRFGDFTLNVEDHSLTRGEENIPLTPKMFDLLLVLVQNPRKVLTKEFLLESVWPNSFVEEGNITFNIRQLRKVLDDNHQSPQFIETVTRRGYRFLAPVEAVAIEAPDAAEARAEESRERPPANRIRLVLAGAAVLVIAAVAVGAWFLRARNGESVPILATPLEAEKLSTDGRVFHVAISPDGKNIVYTNRINGRQSVWLRQLESSNNVQIIPPSDDFYGGLVIAPDGNSIYFARSSQQGPQLGIYRMPIVGGVPQKVTDGAQGWISLSSDGRRLSFVRCPYTDDDYCSLYIADALDGANEKKLVTRPRPIRIGDNKISPDGKTVAFAVGQSRTSSNEFAAMGVDTETGVERELTPERFFNINYMEWLPEDGSFLMTAMKLPDRHFRIWKVSRSGEAQSLTADSETYSRLDIDAQARILVSTQVEPDFRLLLYETDNPTAPPRVVGHANTVAFAQDGSLYFSSNRTGDFELWSAAADGGQLRQLTSHPATDTVPMTSPYSRLVFFESDRTGSIHVWSMEPDGTSQRQVTFGEGGYPQRVSPDGQWLYYRSALKNTLRRVSLTTGEEELVLKEVGRAPTISPDLKHVAFSQRLGTETVLNVISLPDQQTVKSWRLTAAPNLAHLAWSHDGDYLAYVLTDDAREIGSLWFQPMNGDPPRQVADLSGDEIAELQAFALSEDGKRFALIKGTWKHNAVLFRGLRKN